MKNSTHLPQLPWFLMGLIMPSYNSEGNRQRVSASNIRSFY